MLQPSSITSLLTQLIHHDASPDATRPHTALLTLLDSSELYAVATRLVDVPPPKSAVASILASTAAATGAPLPAASGRTAALTLDERASCLSALAVTAWRQAMGRVRTEKEGNVLMPGMTVAVAKHTLTGVKAEKGAARERVPLLLESDLGRILVMPVVPSAPVSFSRGEMDEDEEEAGGESRRPFMLLTLNAAGDPVSQAKTGSMQQSSTNNTASPALASSTATLSANNPTRSRLRSGVTTPTSTRSDLTATPSRSPVSDHFPIGVTGGGAVAGEAEAALQDAGENDAKEAKIWSGLYAQAKALARVLAPSLAKCGVGEDGGADEHHDGRMSAGVSDDDAEN